MENHGSIVHHHSRPVMKMINMNTWIETFFYNWTPKTMTNGPFTLNQLWLAF